MTLEQSSSLVFAGGSPDRKAASAPTVAADRPQVDLADLNKGDSDAIWRLARQLRQEWRRERYSRLVSD
jgi:hypothetical protein